MQHFREGEIGFISFSFIIMANATTTSPAIGTLEAIRNDCEAWLNHEMDMTAGDLLIAIQAAADSAVAKAKAPAA